MLGSSTLVFAYVRTCLGREGAGEDAGANCKGLDKKLHGVGSKTRFKSALIKLIFLLK